MHSISNEYRSILFLERIILLLIIQMFNLRCLLKYQDNPFIFLHDVLNTEWQFIFVIINIIIGLAKIEEGRYLECFITFFSFWALTAIITQLLILNDFYIIGQIIAISTITCLSLFIYLFYKKI